MSLTGQFNLQGQQTLAGIRAWAEDVNRAGGLATGSTPHAVELVCHDDGSRRDRVVDLTKRLICDDHVDLLVGPYSAVLTNAAAEVAHEYGKLLWNQGGASPLVYQQGNPWIVGILSPADEYLSGLLSAVREANPEATTLGILRAATGAFPRDVAAGVLRSAAELGFQQVLSLEFDPAADDFSGVAQVAVEAKPDVLVVAGRFQNDLRIAELLSDAAAGIGAVAVVAAGVDAFHEWLGDKAERFIGPSQWEPEASGAPDHGPDAAKVQLSLRRAGHSVIDYPMAQAYAVGVVIQRCVEECGSLDGGQLRQAAASLDFTTFYGRFRIDGATGRQIGKPSLLVQWRQGRKVVVWPPEHRQGMLEYPWQH